MNRNKYMSVLPHLSTVCMSDNGRVSGTILKGPGIVLSAYCWCLFSFPFRYMISLTSRSKIEDSGKERSLSLSTMIYEDSVSSALGASLCTTIY